MNEPRETVKEALAKYRAKKKADAKAKVKLFLNEYYGDLDGDLNQMERWFREDSILTHGNGDPSQGLEAITNQLRAFRHKYEHSVHNISETDCQFTEPESAGAIFALVSGILHWPREPRPVKYSQMFHLIPAEGGFYIKNAIFNIIYER